MVQTQNQWQTPIDINIRGGPRTAIFTLALLVLKDIMLNLMKCTNSLHFIYEDPAQKGAKIVQVHRYRTHSLDATQVPSPPKRGSFTKKTLQTSCIKVKVNVKVKVKVKVGPQRSWCYKNMHDIGLMSSQYKYDLLHLIQRRCQQMAMMLGPRHLRTWTQGTLTRSEVRYKTLWADHPAPGELTCN